MLLMFYGDVIGFSSGLNLNPFVKPSLPSPPFYPHRRFHSSVSNVHRHAYRLPQTQSSIFSTTTTPFHFPKRRRRRVFFTRAGESPYQVLGVSPSATPLDIKRAYRKLALKYHPDVNKDPGAQEKFMRIKHAYNTLLDSKSRKPKDDGYSDYSYSQRNRTQTNPRDEEDFYGLADFFRDVQEEFRNWERNSSSQGKPKSLWEELSEIGEEFVEFLEKELNITDSVDKAEFSSREGSQKNMGADSVGSNMKNEDGKNSSIEDNIDEIEATLAQLKKELGI